MKRRQAGFTLTELMVVVAIIGVMVTMAVVYMRPRVRPVDVANRLGDLVHEASRRAVALGPVRPDVVTALGSKARTQIQASLSGTTVTFTLYRLQEGAPGIGTWIPLEVYPVHANVLAVQWGVGIGDHTMATSTTWDPPPGPPQPFPNGLTIQCKPDGTCDSRTVFFQAVIPGPDCNTVTSDMPDQCAKLSTMPLGGAITTHVDWL